MAISNGAPSRVRTARRHGNRRCYRTIDLITNEGRAPSRRAFLARNTQTWLLFRGAPLNAMSRADRLSRDSKVADTQRSRLCGPPMRSLFFGEAKYRELLPLNAADRARKLKKRSGERLFAKFQSRHINVRTHLGRATSELLALAAPVCVSNAVRLVLRQRVSIKL